MTSRCPLRATPALGEDAFALVRRSLVLDACKWDPQVGDVDALARYALVIDRSAWTELAAQTESLASELHRLEEELLHRPDLHSVLGLPAPLRALFRRAETATPAGARSLRFDFHWTDNGFALSEVNSDVPGGFCEASTFSALMLEQLGGRLHKTGDPGERWAEALCGRIDAESPVALLVAPGFLEDVQVVIYFRRVLAARGVRTVIGHARHVVSDGAALRFKSSEYEGRIAAVVRFYQGEWLAKLDAFGPLERLFVGGTTLVTNPGTAVLTESKRLPLLWDHLRAPTRAFRAAMPETRDVREAPWLRDADEWVIKGAYGNTGDDVFFPERLSRRARAALAMRLALRPHRWVAQRRFHVALIATPFGDARPCIGIYTVDGRVAGTYARIATSPIVDGAAIDAACFVEAA